LELCSCLSELCQKLAAVLSENCNFLPVNSVSHIDIVGKAKSKLSWLKVQTLPEMSSRKREHYSSLPIVVKK